MSDPSAIKAVIWDFGGVLQRTADPAPRQQLAERLGTSRRELEYQVFSGDSSVQAQLGKISHKQHWENIRQHYNMPVEAMPDFINSFWAGDNLDKDLTDIIQSLQTRYRTALLSNAWDNLRTVLTCDWQIMDAFQEVVISAEVGLMKPDPKIYRLVLEKVGAEPQEVVFIDDFLENIEAARRQGINVVHFQTRAQALGELRQWIDGFSI